MADAQIALLARRLRALEKSQMARKTPQLANSTIVGGAVQATDASGETLTMIVGEQFDGTSTSSVVTGPTPPTPTVPLAVPGYGSASIYWDGTFEGGAFAPMDFQRVTVHAYESATFTTFDPVDQAHIFGEINHATGGEVTISLPANVEHLIFLVAWSQAGKFSGYSDPATVTASGVDVPLPTEPPAGSPAFTVTGTPNTLIVKTEDIPTQTDLKYHISTTEDFTADSSTLVATTRSTLWVIDHLPNGDPLALGTTYYLQVIAGNIIGDAVPNGEVSAALDPDAINSIIANRVTAGFALFGQIDIGDKIRMNPDVGIEVTSDAGITKFPTNGEAPYVAGKLKALELDIAGNLAVNGSGSLNGILGLKAGVVAPAVAPNPGYEVPRVLADGALGDGSTDNQWIWNDLAADVGTVGDPGNRSASASAFLGGSIRFVDHRTGYLAAYPDPTAGKAWTENFDIFGGIAADAARKAYYVMGRDRNRSGDFYVYAIDADTFNKVGEARWWSESGVAGAFPRIAYYHNGTTVNNTLHIAWVHSNNKVYLRKVTVSGSTGSSISFTNISGGAPADIELATLSSRIPMGALEVGPFDSPTSTVHVAWTYGDSGSFQVRKQSDGSASTELGAWTRPSGKVRGMRWITGGTFGSRFIVLDNYGYIYHHSEIRNNTAIRAAQTSYDADTGGTGTHETDIGVSTADYTIPARSWAYAVTKQAPDEGSTDANLDKATATRLYMGIGSGAKYLYETLGKIARTESVTVAASAGLFGTVDTTSQISSWSTTGLARFTAEDIGATVTGTDIQAGTTITDVPAQYGGTVAILSLPHTQTGSATRTVTITRSIFSHRSHLFSSLLTTGSTPPGSNGFIGASVTPGILRSDALNNLGENLIKMDGAGNFRLGGLHGSWDGTNNVYLLTNDAWPLYEATSTSVSSIPTATFTDHGAWSRSPGLTGAGTYFSAYSNGTWTFSQAGRYMLTFSYTWSANSTGRRIAVFKKNGSEVRRVNIGAAANEMTIEVVHLVDIAVGDTITTNIYQNSGGNLALLGSATPAVFQAQRVA